MRQVLGFRRQYFVFWKVNCMASMGQRGCDESQRTKKLKNNNSILQ